MNDDLTEQQSAGTRVVDPSTAVTGLGFLFGLVGAVVGIGATIFLSSGSALALIFYCLLGALGGGSAGIVTGGMLGAIFAVLRGVPAPRRGKSGR